MRNNLILLDNNVPSDFVRIRKLHLVLNKNFSL